MSHHYATPGVYIEEQTGPGVIAGVGTSTAVFIGPTLRGPINEPMRLTSFDEFIANFGGMRDNRPWPYLLMDDRAPYYLPFAVEGFFTNGGQYAYILRVGTAVQANLMIQNRGGDDIFVVRAIEDGEAGNGIQVETQAYAVQDVAAGSAAITAGSVSDTITVDHPEHFRVGDTITDGTDRREITAIRSDVMELDGTITGPNIRIADIETAPFRMVDTAGLYNGGTALISAGANEDRVLIDHVDTAANFVTLAAAPSNTYDPTATALTSIRVVSTGAAEIDAITTITGTDGIPFSQITLADASGFRPGDIVTADGGTHRAQISRISGSDLILDSELTGASAGDTLRIADIIPAQLTFRVEDRTGLYPGSVVLLAGSRRQHCRGVCRHSVNKWRGAGDPGTGASPFSYVQPGRNGRQRALSHPPGIPPDRYPAIVGRHHHFTGALRKPLAQPLPSPLYPQFRYYLFRVDYR